MIIIVPVIDFLKSWLPNGKYPNDSQKHLRITDTEVIAGIRNAFHDSKHPGHIPAKCILARGHFRLFYRSTTEDIKINPEASLEVYRASAKKYGEDFVRLDKYEKNAGVIDFPVLTNENKIKSCWTLSKILPQIPSVGFEYVFIAPHLKDEAQKWLNEERKEIIKPIIEEE